MQGEGKSSISKSLRHTCNYIRDQSSKIIEKSGQNA